MSLVRRVLSRVTSQFPERLVKRVLRESTVLGGLAGQIPQGFENGIHLDFANSFHYIKTPGNDPTIAPFTSLFTFTGDNKSMYRGANGLLVASATNTPRIEYDANGNLLGLLIEGARTNLCLQSQVLGTTWTTNAASISSNAIVAPDGTTTADKIQEDNTNAAHYAVQSITTAGAAHTFSCYLKAGERTKAMLAIFTATNAGTIFDLVNGTIGGNANISAPTSATIQAVGNGWYRCSVTHTTTAAANNFRILCASNDSGASGDITYLGTTNSGVYAWGAQVEQAAFPSSYIPTTTGSVTRTADVCTRTYGAEVSGSVGTLFAECDSFAEQVTNAYNIVSLNDGTNNNCIRQFLYQTQAGLTVRASAVSSADFGPTAWSRNVMLKTASTFAGNDAQTVLNGTLGSGDTSVTLPVVTRMDIGSNNSLDDRLFGHIRRLDYWPERKPNSELQRLTT